MQILGIQRITKQNGQNVTVLHVTRDFDEYESRNGQGIACENIYIGKPLPYLKLGDYIDLVYAKGFMGKAVIRDVVVLPDSNSVSFSQ